MLPADAADPGTLPRLLTPLLLLLLLLLPLTLVCCSHVHHHHQVGSRHHPEVGAVCKRQQHVVRHGSAERVEADD
jgi:hypothetical protein